MTDLKKKQQKRWGKNSSTDAFGQPIMGNWSSEESIFLQSILSRTGMMNLQK